LETIDPRTGYATARIAGGDKEDVDLAVKAAVMLLKAARGLGCPERYALNYIFL
jgi:3-oxoacyl-[acyl-carrier-protein] synthase III